MKTLYIFLFLIFFTNLATAQVRVVNPGETHGQLVYLSAEDILDESDKYKSLSPLSIPVFAEMPFDMSDVAGTITLKPQGALSHVLIKARAKKIPNLDISALEQGMNDPIFGGFTDGDWVHLIATAEGEVSLTQSNQGQAQNFYRQKVAAREPIDLVADIETQTIFTMDELGWQDFDKVGSKAANYAELARALNTNNQTLVRPSMAVPFYYYSQFVDNNPILKDAISNLLRDPLMRRISASRYREEKLSVVRGLIESDATLIDESFLNELLTRLDNYVDAQGHKMKMKLRSSTNAEDLPNFNGAGLYTSESYKPNKNGEEKSTNKKLKSLKKAIKVVWGSVWNLRAYEEREAFAIAHDQIYMAIQINPSYSNEEADGVLVTANVAQREDLQGAGVYIEAQRGDDHSVANPLVGVESEKILVLYNEQQPLDKSQYEVHVLAQSNIADDMITVLPNPNPVPVLQNEEIKELVYQSLKAVEHFAPVFAGEDQIAKPLDIEFKVDDLDTGSRSVYLKQVRPFIQ